MTPLQVRYCSLSFLPATPSSWSRTLEGLFELKVHPSRASPHAFIQRYKDTVRYVELAKRGGHRAPLETTDTNLDCVVIKKPHTFSSEIELMTRPRLH